MQEQENVSAPTPQAFPATEALIRPLEEGDLTAADRIFRLAFGTFLGLPDPTRFHAGAEFVRNRWLAYPDAAFVAVRNSEVVGSIFAANWGSMGFFGPLTVRPDLWDQGIAKRLLAPVVETFDRWGTRHAGLFTFAHSIKHVGLYQKFGFWPRFLTAIMSKPVAPSSKPAPSTFSQLSREQQADAIKACRELTDAVYEGLDLSPEILAVEKQKLGDTVLVWDDGKLAALAICHCGPGTEAGPDTCYIKFGAVRPKDQAVGNFASLLCACESLAAQRKLSKLVAGVNTSRDRAYRKMLAFGFRTQFQGVTMHRASDAGYDRSSLYVIDDWR